MVDDAINKRTDLNDGSKQIDDMTLDELDELEDSEDEEVLQEYRKRRIAEMRALASKAKFGTVREISGQDYVSEVTKAGDGIWVVLHLYANGVPLCAIIHHHMQQLAARFPQTKFLRSIATTCIPNFPEKNLPTIFIYHEGQLKKQYIGSLELRGEKLTLDELEFLMGQAGAITTDIKEDPRPQIRDKMLADLENQNIDFY
uniref:Viral IAP-associated factor n=2 Tax=Ceratitis capitata TaxID=7213 RepID=W8B138_CERCA